MKPNEMNSADEFSSAFSPEQAVVRYLTWCRDTRNRSPQTLRSYTSTLQAYVDWLSGRGLDGPDRGELEDFIARDRIRKGRPRIGSPATRKREVACLRGFYRWATVEGLVDRDPTANLHGPKVQQRNPNPIDDDRWVALWTSDLCDSDRVALGLGFFCGLRKAEIMSLQGRQVSATRIRDFVRKGGGEDTLPWAEMLGVYEDRLPELVVDPYLFTEALNRCRRADRDPLLGWSNLGPLEFNRRIDKLCTRLELKRFTPHQLRHSCATNLLRAGVPLHLVASLMNHSNTTITMRYVKAGGGELAEWRRSLH